MEKSKNHEKATKKAEITKQNQDFPNIPASSEKIKSEHIIKKEIKETSKLHNEGKTDNNDKNEN